MVNILFVQAHPEARSLRVKTLQGYRKLCVIFGEESMDTRYIHLSHNADPNSELSMLITGMIFTLITTIRQYLVTSYIQNYLLAAASKVRKLFFTANNDFIFGSKQILIPAIYAEHKTLNMKKSKFGSNNHEGLWHFTNYT